MLEWWLLSLLLLMSDSSLGQSGWKWLCRAVLFVVFCLCVEKRWNSVSGDDRCCTVALYNVFIAQENWWCCLATTASRNDFVWLNVTVGCITMNSSCSTAVSLQIRTTVSNAQLTLTTHKSTKNNIHDTSHSQRKAWTANETNEHSWNLMHHKPRFPPYRKTESRGKLQFRTFQKRLSVIAYCSEEGESPTATHRNNTQCAVWNKRAAETTRAPHNNKTRE